MSKESEKKSPEIKEMIGKPREYWNLDLLRDYPKGREKSGVFMGVKIPLFPRKIN